MLLGKVTDRRIKKGEIYEVNLDKDGITCSVRSLSENGVGLTQALQQELLTFALFLCALQELILFFRVPVAIYVNYKKITL